MGKPGFSPPKYHPVEEWVLGIGVVLVIFLVWAVSYGS